MHHNDLHSVACSTGKGTLDLDWGRALFKGAIWREEMRGEEEKKKGKICKQKEEWVKKYYLGKDVIEQREVVLLQRWHHWLLGKVFPSFCLISSINQSVYRAIINNENLMRSRIFLCMAAIAREKMTFKCTTLQRDGRTDVPRCWKSRVMLL